MTEYDPSPEAIEEYHNSRSRTAAWLHRLEVESLRAPSECPTRIDDALLPSCPPSDAGSSRSVPPKMLLRYNDGRPDQPIPQSSHTPMKRHSRRHHERVDSMERSRTLPYTPSHHSRPSLPDAFIAASKGKEHSPSRSRHRRRSDKSAKEKEGSRTPHEGESMLSLVKQSRSKSLPQEKELRAATRSSGHAGSTSSRTILPPPTPPMPIPSSRPLSHGHRSVVPSTPLSIVSSPWHPSSVRVVSSTRHQRPPHSPPAIVYAPGHHSQAHYSPPAIYTQPPTISPHGTIVSHFPPEYGMPASYPPVSARSSEQGRRSKDSRKREGNAQKRTKHQRSSSVPLNGGKPRRPPHSPSHSSETASEHSGSTYYVIPNAGQKVHVINPDASTTIYTATSTTRSPTSPRSLKSLKRSFFQRLLSMTPKFPSRSTDSTKESAKGSTTTARKLTRRLLRRHSTSGGSQASS
ncbi:hypothetical protein BD626DRAFT_572794 [Schizophyllum amplum]|uniref:Uncharacterized protein n=1 Tax=Schizophyllum amplum TaxID=97359 RepID=A0A550C339_9AGAR|nr:hypothetical protein BD626DRAFT_572794 [Auriculariopsis ampla]